MNTILKITGILMLISVLGCAGYRIGNQSLYNKDIRTVYVPIFESESYRKHLGERLTEAVIKRIEGRCPYKVVGRKSADTMLTGLILSESQMVKSVNDYDDTRQKSYTMVVEIRWIDRRTGNNIRHFNVRTDSHLVAEMGQSLTTAQQKVIDDLADQIVELMETPW